MNPKERALARLSLAALILDGFLCFTIFWFAKPIADLAPTQFQLVAACALFIGIVILYIFIGEVMAFGHTIGRACLGLTVKPRNQTHALTPAQRLKRFATIIMSIGIRSLNINRLAAHNASEFVSLNSTIVGNSDVATIERRGPQGKVKHAPKPELTRRISKQQHLVIEVLAGPHHGTKVELGQGRTFTSDGIFRIGRDSSWSDLTLSKDAVVSSRHCRIIKQNDKIHIADGETAEKPSRNGSWLDGRRIGNASPIVFPTGGILTLGESQLRLSSLNATHK